MYLAAKVASDEAIRMISIKDFARRSKRRWTRSRDSLTSISSRLPRRLCGPKCNRHIRLILNRLRTKYKEYRRRIVIPVSKRNLETAEFEPSHRRPTALLQANTLLDLHKLKIRFGRKLLIFLNLTI